MQELETKGTERASTILQIRDAETERQKLAPAKKTFSRTILDDETEYEELCYYTAKASNHLNRTHLTKEDMMAMSLYDFYKLKQLLRADKNPVS